MHSVGVYGCRARKKIKTLFNEDVTDFRSAFFLKDLQGLGALSTRTIRNSLISSLVPTLIEGLEQVLSRVQGPPRTVQGREVHPPEVAHKSHNKMQLHSNFGL